MLYLFLYPFRDHIFFFNLFRYITFRAMAASVTAFAICIIFGPMVMRWLVSLSVFDSHNRAQAEKIHQFFAHKKTVPTMGGVLILLSIVLSNLLWGNLANQFLILALVVTVWFGTVGFIDDYIKIRKRNTTGLTIATKFIAQVIAGVAIGAILYFNPEFNDSLYVPFFKNVVLRLGIFYIPFIVLVLVGSSNALNLTDGLDGLAIGCLIMAAGAYTILSYISGHFGFADYLKVPFFRSAGELTVFCASLVGAGIGFLWFNSYPASVFMGDTGSLALGGALGAVAVFIKKEFLLLIVGGIFVWEALSVILQVSSFKWTGKRIFLMAPYHHHLQLKGWPESKVTVRFWIIAFLLAVLGISTLKIQ